MERILANYHTHSTFCDGSNTLEEMAEEALRRGFHTLGFSGHMDPDIHMDFPAYVQEIRRLQEKYAGKLEILLGVELDNVYDPHCAPEAEYIIGSTHFLDVPPINGEYFSVDSSPENLKKLCDTYFGGDYCALSAAYYALEAQVGERLHPTFVGHFDLITRFNDLPKEAGGHFLNEDDPAYYEPAMRAMERLVSEGLPFEINCGAVNRNRKKYFYPHPRLLKHLHELGGEILISSDAHQRELIDGAFPEALAAAREAGFESVLILTRDGTSAGSPQAKLALIPADKACGAPADKTPAMNTKGLFWSQMRI